MGCGWREWAVADVLLRGVAVTYGAAIRTAGFICVAAACATAACSAAGAAEPQQMPVVRYGEFVADVSGPVPRPPGSTGVSDGSEVANVEFVRATGRVEARLCAVFGMTVAVKGAEPVQVTRRLVHPLFVRPDGREGTVETTEDVFSSGLHDVIYILDEPWEAVPGTWTFSVLFEGAVVAEQSLELVAPSGTRAARSGRCGAPTS